MTSRHVTSHAMTRRTVLGSLFGLGAAATLAGCSSAATTASSSTIPAASTTPSSTPSASTSSAAGSTTSPSLAQLVADVPSTFTQSSWTDPTTGKALPFNVFLPKGYSAAKKYPLVVYIADSSLVGKDTTAPLSQYGALIWASEQEQAKHPSIVVVPEYPEVVLDDQSGYTTTDWLELTVRFVTALGSTYSVDTARVYGTGQSMGCMMALYLAAKHPQLYTATLLVSGQWDISALQPLASQKFFHICAAGDQKATAGQSELKAMLDDKAVAYGETTLDATWTQARQDQAVATELAAGHRANFASFTAGSVLTANPSAGQMEHMASFEPAYKITTLRDWLFAQHR